MQLEEVLGGYRLVEELGAGSTSTVFRGEHVRLGRWAAVKVLSPDLVGDPDVRARMFTEAKVVNDIRHPNIVDVTDFVEQEEPPRVALIMEHIPGPTLRAFRGAPLPLSVAVEICRQMASAVSAAHAQGVIHRDLKPDNVLLMQDPREPGAEAPMVKVVDFGIAKVAGPGDHARTAFGTLLGTPAYMAPEQVAGSPSPSSGTDVYALAEIVYELVTGDRLFSSQKTEETVRSKLRGEHPEVRMPSNLQSLSELIVRSLQARPERRPTMVEWTDMLASLSADSPRATPKPSLQNIPDHDTGAATQLAGVNDAVTTADSAPGVIDHPTELAPLAPAAPVGGGLLGPAGLATGSSEFSAMGEPRDEQTASGESWEASSAELTNPALNEMPLSTGDLPPPPALDPPTEEIDDNTRSVLPELDDLQAAVDKALAAPSPEFNETVEASPEPASVFDQTAEVAPVPATGVEHTASPAQIFSKSMAEPVELAQPSSESSKGVLLAVAFVLLSAAALVWVLVAA